MADDRTLKRTKEHRLLFCNTCITDERVVERMRDEVGDVEVVHWYTQGVNLTEKMLCGISVQQQQATVVVEYCEKDS